MEERLIITLQDIKVIRPMADLDEARVDPHIKEAQKLYLKPLLNPTFYYDFIKNFDNPDAQYEKYRELLNGKEWTNSGNVEYFEGIKPMLCYYALASLCEENPMNITRHGIVRKVQTNSEPIDAATLKQAINKLKSAGSVFESEVVRFIEANKSTYPLYDKQPQTAGKKPGGLNFFKL